MKITIGLIAFILFLALIETTYYAYRTMRYAHSVKLRSRLRKLSSDGNTYQSPDVSKTRSLSQIPWLNHILSSIPGLNQLDRALEKANIQKPLGLFLLLSLFLAVTGFFVSSSVIRERLIAVVIALFLGSIPLLYIHSKKKQRMQKLHSQLPDALDTIARAMKAGHAFPTGMKIVADEFDDPIGTEFDRTFDEINFGISVFEALKNLSKRVECVDLDYFVVSVIIQRETGGNLAEILESIAGLIRERFKFQGRVQVLSAEAKLSAVILTLLPFFVVLALSFINPDYIGKLTDDPLGRTLVAISITMIITGILFMKRMVKIEV